ncbi:hypothetical protein GCM10011497_36410 [Elstera cyanobacteriorum]|uniref:hypothetical protein n=1 Tax=Elstera cyanobacteriorum TaxID=2022747 RepID=UPI00198E99F2|nr:hypothetical protein [Elstera cyanobacteriorum]GGA02436.1 hypothetical protein GCM10011497_36410 [Elstera cyanobacteriorum]
MSWRQFLGFLLGDCTPDENTIRHFHNRLPETGTLKRGVKAFDWQLQKKGYIPMAGQNIDDSLVPAPKQRNSEGGAEGYGGTLDAEDRRQNIRSMAFRLR